LKKGDLEKGALWEIWRELVQEKRDALARGSAE
jgi:hypothetical protein